MTASPHILLVTGISGAGKSTVLRTLEDLGWEVIDNLPLSLLESLVATEQPVAVDGAPAPDLRPIAVGIGARTRGFDADHVAEQVERLRDERGFDVGTLFLDCDDGEIERRYNETRRRHPLALDRPAEVGIARERELLEPLRRWANRLIDTTALSASDLAHEVRRNFTPRGWGAPVLSVMSFGFTRGLPRNADIVLDMRFLRNPHWVPSLRPGTGRDRDVADYVAADPAYPAAMASIETLLGTLLPRYQAEGKSYVALAFGCTGGRHRSVHVAERMAAWLRERGFSPTVRHRDLGTAPQDSLEDAPQAP